ncbi:MAG TPA: type II toxin-antitoxin system VapC family toxin [Vicinamibacteria bacterium]|nr:type II toxin-antitoxin system VapC family toxin [Vicinamibacteria bacterium]
MNAVDSSGWLEYLAEGPNARHFADPLERTAELIVPSLCLTEVFKIVARQRGELDALQAVALMQQAKVIDLDRDIALFAARAGLIHRLPLADSIVLATARAYAAIVWTQDVDFEGLESVQYFPKKK